MFERTQQKFQVYTTQVFIYIKVISKLKPVFLLKIYFRLHSPVQISQYKN